MSGFVERYLKELEALLFCHVESKRRILDEVRDHLREALERERAKGSSEGHAEDRVTARFGPPEVVAQAFMEEFKGEVLPVDGEVKVSFQERRLNPTEEYTLPPEKGAGPMWHRFTERTRRVIFFSQEEAARFSENYVGTEHLLLGLLREKDSHAARILVRYMGVDLRIMRDAIRSQMAQGEGRNRSQEMQLTPRAKRVIDLAYEETRTLNNNYLGSEHLLLGLIQEGEGLAGRVLHSMGVELDRTREVIRAYQERFDVTIQRPMRPTEVVRLITKTRDHLIRVSDIKEIRIQTHAGKWTGKWGGVEIIGSQTPTNEWKGRDDDKLENVRLSPEEVERINAYVREYPEGDLGQYMAEEGATSEVEIACALAKSMNMRFWDLEESPPDADAVRAVSAAVARQYRLIPVKRKDTDLLIAIADPTDPEAKDAVIHSSLCRVTFCIAAPWQIRKAIREWYGEEGEGGGAVVPRPKPPPSPQAPEAQVWP